MTDHTLQTKKDLLDGSVAGILAVTIDALNRAIEVTEHGNKHGVPSQISALTLRDRCAGLKALAAQLK